MAHRFTWLATLGAVFVLGAALPAMAEPGWGWHHHEWSEPHRREAREHRHWDHDRWFHDGWDHHRRSW